MEKLFESWKRRKLTLFGKSCIINTLAISKLIYVASILCLPGKEFLKKIQRLIFNFVWNKSERIKRNTLIGDVRNGGLGIIDVESKLKALKAAWLPRILKSKGVLYNILNGFCNKYNIDVMYVLQFSSNVDNLKFPLFYKEILCSLNECKISRLDVMSNVDIVRQPIWNNCNMRYKGNVLFFENWVKSGILFVKDILDNNGKIRTLESLTNVLKDRSNWLCEYKTIISVLKSVVRKYDFANTKFVDKKIGLVIFFQTGYDNLYGKKCNFFYKNFIKKKFTKPCYQTKLSKEFEIHDTQQWEKIYVCKILEVEDKQLSDFNYRLLNNILCNNAYLCKWKVDVKPECRMCNKMETSYHLIYECKNVLLIWRLLSEFLSFDVKWKHIIKGFYLENNRRSATIL